MEKTYMTNILVTGSRGQLGSELQYLVEKQLLDTSGMKFFFTDKASLDVTDHVAVKKYALSNNINMIINCAAYTAVDKAEENLELADALNREAVKQLARIAADHKIGLVHISTDYVYDGTSHKPYTEDDPSNPQGIYSKTKLAGEHEIKQINPDNTIIIRTSWVYSSFGNNFVKTMLKLCKERDELDLISDQVGTPTYARDLAKAIIHIIQHPIKTKNNIEIYHFSNEGGCSWYDFAKTIFELSNIECKVNPIDTNEYPTPAKRPYYSLLSKSKIKNDYKMEIPYWRDSLKECLQIILSNKTEK
jgi:dTDP-4-dehydrorhamnose reductase